jgi:DnaJ-class molecular chaperone
MVETRRGDPYVEEPTHDRDTTERVDGVERVDATDNRCSHCQGSGRQVCAYCEGTGRTNFKGRVMLPKGVWPVWCSRCIRCSGMTICSCCLGSGKKREPIGFRV